MDSSVRHYRVDLSWILYFFFSACLSVCVSSLHQTCCRFSLSISLSRFRLGYCSNVKLVVGCDFYSVHLFGAFQLMDEDVFLVFYLLVLLRQSSRFPSSLHVRTIRKRSMWVWVNCASKGEMRMRIKDAYSLCVSSVEKRVRP